MKIAKVLREFDNQGVRTGVTHYFCSSECRSGYIDDDTTVEYIVDDFALSEESSEVCEFCGKDLNPKLWWVALYRTDKRYGGPEEGGWWYNTGYLCKDLDTYMEILMLPQAFATAESARFYRDEMDRKVQEKQLNDGLHEPSSVLSEGQWLVAEMHEGTLPEYYPEHRPHYE